MVKIFVISHFTMPTDTYSTRVSSIGNTQEILGHPNAFVPKHKIGIHLLSLDDSRLISMNVHI